MVTHVSLQCPFCGQNCDIFLSDNATFIILNCPECAKPLVYHNKTCQLLSRSQMQRIRNAHPKMSLGQVIEELAYDVSAVKPHQQTQHAGALSPQRAQQIPSGAKRPERPAISRDDITNLQIELAMCSDCRDFIDKL